MQLNHLIAPFIETTLTLEIVGLTLDSRDVKSGYLFIALAGKHQHGLSYARQAIQQGAVAILYSPEQEGELLAASLSQIPVIKIAQLESKLADLAAPFYQHPSQQLSIIGITGTNGKTSCSQFLAQMLPKSIAIGTLGWGEWGQLHKTQNTTPNALVLQSILAKCVHEHKHHIMLEVSSHGLVLERVKHLHFNGAVFTNLTPEHLDFHGSMDAYFQAKLTLFKCPQLKFAVINLDDSYSTRLIAEIPQHLQVWSFSQHDHQHATVLAKNIRYLTTGLCFDVVYQHQTLTVQCSFYGRFNVENILAVITVLLAKGITLSDAINRASALQPIIGRMQQFGGEEKPLVFVDYAHTPDALKNALNALKQHQHPFISLVFGCGGNRDLEKRLKMGEIACQLANTVIVTDDNPRDEQSEDIINDILVGCQTHNVTIIPPRKLAIQTAIANASTNTCVLIAGKGHEDYQEIKGIKSPFSDQTIVQQALQQWSHQ